jgi:hypothetical protein
MIIGDGELDCGWVKSGRGGAKGSIDRPEAWRIEVCRATSDRMGEIFYFNRS